MLHKLAGDKSTLEKDKSELSNALEEEAKALEEVDKILADTGEAAAILYAINAAAAAPSPSSKQDVPYIHESLYAAEKVSPTLPPQPPAAASSLMHPPIREQSRLLFQM